MPEVQEQATSTENKETKIASIGKVQRIENPVIKAGIAENGIVNDTKEAASNETGNNNGNENKAAELLKPTESQLKEYFKSIGVEYEGDEKIKEKLTAKTQTELTSEQKLEQAKNKEKKLLDIYLAANPKNTIDTYNHIKSIANGDVVELSQAALKNELRKLKFTDEQIEDYIKESLNQIEDAEIDKYADETEKEFLKRKKEHGKKVINSYASSQIKQAQNILAELNEELELEDLEAQQEQTLSSKIDETFKSLPRKLTFAIGEINGKPIPPVDYEVSEDDLTESLSLLKDPVKRQQFLYNPDGSLNITNLSNVLSRNKYLESAVKAAHHSGMNMAVSHFGTVFGTSPQEIGVGGSPKDKTGGNGQPASFGKPQRVNPR